MLYSPAGAETGPRVVGSGGRDEGIPGIQASRSIFTPGWVSTRFSH